MSSTSRLGSSGAAFRFGFGPRAGHALPAGDIRDALLAEIERPGAGRIDNPDLLTSGEGVRATADIRRARRAQRIAERDAARLAAATGSPAGKPPGMAAGGMAAAPDMGGMGGGMERPASSAPMQSAAAPPDTAQQNAAPPNRTAPPANAVPNISVQIYMDEAEARFAAALDAEIGFAERWVWFWSNHFCISSDKGPTVRAQTGSFEREAIRAHAFGRFADMLKAVERHPAMLIYLDNARSIGPTSVAGRRLKRGLNENLAREILELHTLGVRSVYTQEDVTAFAKVITGWTTVPLAREPDGGEFAFNASMHEPGAHTVIGVSYPEDGVRQGHAVLEALARHPATARHVAGKLARHFVSDDAPPALVERLAGRFLETEGDLKEVARALVTAPEAWSAGRGKLKRPGEWLISSMRCTGQPLVDVRRVVNVLPLLGEPLWRPSSPKGFPDDEAAWIDGLAQRLDIANLFARRAGGTSKIPDLAGETLGPLLSPSTRQTLARAESRVQALALLMMSPELQRR